jgi:hypothetical protein
MVRQHRYLNVRSEKQEADPSTSLRMTEKKKDYREQNKVKHK